MLIDVQFNPARNPWPVLRDATVAAESAGFGAAWVYDHLAGRSLGGQDMLEAFTLLGALAATTTSIGLGTMVANVTARDPGVLGVAAASVSAIADRPVLLGIGAGSSPQGRWAAEMHTVGRPVEPTMAGRHAVVERTLGLLDAMWSTDRGDEWESFPLPHHPVTVLVGLNSVALAELAGRRADGINVAWHHPRRDELIDAATAAHAASGRPGDVRAHGLDAVGRFPARPGPRTTTGDGGPRDRPPRSSPSWASCSQNASRRGDRRADRGLLRCWSWPEGAPTPPSACCSPSRLPPASGCSPSEAVESLVDGGSRHHRGRRGRAGPMEVADRPPRPGAPRSCVVAAVLGARRCVDRRLGDGIRPHAGAATVLRAHRSAAPCWRGRGHPRPGCRPVAARPRRVLRSDLSRRTLLRAGALAAGAAAGWGVVRIVGADRRGTGSIEVGSDDPSSMPVTQWLFDEVPDVDVEGWRLDVAGRQWSYSDLLGAGGGRRRPEGSARLHGRLVGVPAVGGVRLDHLLGAALDGAASIEVRSVTGYGRRFPAADASRLWLATTVGGEPLSPGHGSPARLVAPGRRGSGGSSG